MDSPFKNKCSLSSSGSINSDGIRQKFLTADYIYTIWKGSNASKLVENDAAYINTEFNVFLNLGDLMSTKLTGNLKFNYGKGRNIIFKLDRSIADGEFQFLISSEQTFNLWNDDTDKTYIDCVTQVEKQFGGYYPHRFFGVAFCVGCPRINAAIRANNFETPDADDRITLSGQFNGNVWKHSGSDVRFDIESNCDWIWNSRKSIGGGITFSKGFDNSLSIKINRTFDTNNRIESDIIFNNTLWESDYGFIIESGTSLRYVWNDDPGNIEPNMDNYATVMDAGVSIFTKDSSKMLFLNVGRSEGIGTSLSAYYKHIVWEDLDGGNLSVNFYVRKFFDNSPANKFTFGVGFSFIYSFFW